ncbi:g8812 [Coccomyxa elongata]
MLCLRLPMVLALRDGILKCLVQVLKGNSMVALHPLVESHWGTRGQEYQHILSHITLGTQRRLEQDY